MALTARQKLLVEMAQAASIGNLDRFADELLSYRAGDLSGIGEEAFTAEALRRVKASMAPELRAALVNAGLTATDAPGVRVGAPSVPPSEPT